MSNARTFANYIKSSGDFDVDTDTLKVDVSADTVGINGSVFVNRTSSIAGGVLSLDYTNGATAGLGIKDTQTSGTGVPLQIINGAGTTVGSVTQDQSSVLFQSDTLADGIKYGRYGIVGRGIELYNQTGVTISTSATSYYQNSSGLLETAPYMLTIQASGAPLYTESWSGIMQWMGGTTNSVNADDIYLNAMGHARNNQSLYARTKRQGSNQQNHALQVWASSTLSNISLKIYATKLSTQGW